MTAAARRFAAVLGITAVAPCAQAGAAFATDYYVNGVTGSDTNNCLSPTPGAPGIGPCDTIAAAITKAQDSDGNNVLIADDADAAMGQQPYNENVTPVSGMTLSSSDGDLDPKPVINGKVTIGSTGASLDHLAITSPVSPAIQANGPGTIADNDIAGNNVAGSYGVQVTVGTGNLTIARNVFTDDGVGEETAVFKLASSMSVSVVDNDIDGYWRGIFASDLGGAVIRGNEISGTHQAGAFDGEGITLYGGLGYEITGNVVRDPASASLSGIFVGQVNQPASATLARNRVLGTFDTAISVLDTDSFSSSSDVVSGSGHSFETVDGVNPPPATGDATVTNATFWAASVDNLLADGAEIALNSSIVGDGTVNNGGVCSISFSRGDVAPGLGTPDPTDCDDFQTAADPTFVNAGANDFHLMPGSPMIDAGDPAPAAGLLDLDGDARSIDGNGDCAATRDIGADELVAGPFPQCLPSSPLPSVSSPLPAPPAAAPKKCKKGRKLKKGKCVRKRRKK